MVCTMTLNHQAQRVQVTITWAVSCFFTGLFIGKVWYMPLLPDFTAMHCGAACRGGWEQCRHHETRASPQLWWRRPPCLCWWSHAPMTSGPAGLNMATCLSGSSLLTEPQLCSAAAFSSLEVHGLCEACRQTINHLARLS